MPKKKAAVKVIHGKAKPKPAAKPSPATQLPTTSQSDPPPVQPAN
jgi:hypothetical protein